MAMLFKSSKNSKKRCTDSLRIAKEPSISNQEYSA